MMKKGLLFYGVAAAVLACALFMPVSASGEQVTGIVFEDNNKNLKPDVGEKGIEGVMVSNGLEVSLTNELGRYVLSVEGEAVIFITKPPGYDAPLDEDNLPSFYYIHRPNGAPAFKYKTLEATGPLPASVDFALFKTEVRNSFDAIVFGDPQPYNSREIGYIRDDVVAELIGSNAAFGITLGDVMGNVLSLYDEYNDVIAQIGIPFYNVPGNHDMNFDAKDDTHSLETFIRHFGPPYYSFEYGRVHFIVLDDIEWHGKTQKRKGYYKGAISKQELAWLKNDLKHVPRDKLVVCSMHIPLKMVKRSGKTVHVKNLKAFLKLLEGREHLLMLGAHTHTLEHHYLSEEDGWNGSEPIHQLTCGTVCGSWWSGPKDVRGIPVADMADGTPNGYYIFHFDGNQYRERYKCAHMDEDFQMRIVSPSGEVSASELESTRIVVNFFNGGPRSVAECRIDDGPYDHMGPVTTIDPFIEDLYKKHKDTLKSWVSPKPSTHIWKSPLPGDLKPGVHTISIKATDRFGRESTAHRLFRVK